MAEQKKSTVSKDLISTYAGQAAGQAQSQLDALTAQRTQLQTQLQERQKEVQQYAEANGSGAQNPYMDQYNQSQTQIQELNRQIASQQAAVSNPLSQVGGVKKEVIEGAQFGEAVLGEEGLGRAKDDADIQTGLSALREQAQGFSSGESLARREKAVEQLGASQQAQRRQLQASLARAGVRGGVAGAQLGQQSADAMNQRSNLERDLFLAGEDAKRTGTQNLITAAGELQRFDLGQAAKEKNIVLQSGLGFAQLGAAERGAQIQAEASKQAAAASRPSCHVAGTRVRMVDGSYKNIEDIKVNEELYLGGKVKIIGTAVADDNIYVYRGEYVTGSHVILDVKMGKYVNVKELSSKRTILPTDTTVYPMVTEKGFYVTESGIHGDIFTEEEEYGTNYKEAREQERRRLANVQVSTGN